MTNLLIEAVLVAFCVGGVFGTVVTMHLMHHSQRKKKREATNTFLCYKK